MKKEGKHIDEVFRERLMHLNVIPPTDVWETVEQRFFRRKKNLLPLYRLAAASVLLMMILGSCWLIFLKKPLEKHLADQPTLSGKQVIEAPVSPNRMQEEKTVKTTTGKIEELHKPSGAVLSRNQEQPVEKPIAGNTIPVVSVQRSTNQIETQVSGVEKVPVPAFSMSARESVTISVPTTPDLFYTDLGISLRKEKVSTIAVWSDLQEEQENTSMKNAKWSLSGNFGPFYSYRVLASQDKDYSSYLNTQENGIFAYAGGINVYYSNGKQRLSLQTGIHYARMGVIANDIIAFKSVKGGNLALLETKGNAFIHLSEGDLTYDENPIFVANETSPEGIDQSEYLLSRVGPGLYEPVNVSLKQDMAFVEIPLILRYKVVDGGFGLNLIGGVGTSILLDGKSILLNGDEIIPLGNTGDLRNMNVNGIAGIGISYQLSEPLSLQLEPTFKYYLNPLNKSGSVYAHPYSFGIYSGIRFTF